MAKRLHTRISRSGTYVVGAAEGRSMRVAAKKGGRTAATATSSDRRRASELLKAKRG